MFLRILRCACTCIDTLITYFFSAPRITLHLIAIDLVGKTLSCRPACDRAFQGSEHAIIRLLGDCGRIRTSLHCTIAAKPIHSHGLLVPLTLLNTVEMRPFGNSASLPVTASHFVSQTRRSAFLHMPLVLLGRNRTIRQCEHPFSLGSPRSRLRRSALMKRTFFLFIRVVTQCRKIRQLASQSRSPTFFPSKFAEALAKIMDHERKDGESRL